MDIDKFLCLLFFLTKIWSKFCEKVIHSTFDFLIKERIIGPTITRVEEKTGRG